ncbi:MAG: 7-carboxy-7-deazaguanine synthase QueE, partial [Pirellulales bacterium]|nr:7-carboxy-7-deazaguanine synthase QueE [Pirellulales bacterium]
LLFAPLVELSGELRDLGLHVTIETAGTVDRDVPCDLLSLSPKFHSSAPDATQSPRWHALHQQRRLPLAVMRKLIRRAPDYQLKFVVDTAKDFDEVLQITAALQVQPNDVWIMPQGSTIEAMDAAVSWLRPWTERQGFEYCDRMQIRWFGNRRGT